MAEEPAALEIRGLAKRFGQKVAVDHLDIVVPAGSFFAHDTIALNDQHSYGLWTSAAVLDMTDPVAAIEFTTNADIVPTPEPASLLLLGSTAAGLIYRKRRAARAAAAKAQTSAV